MSADARRVSLVLFLSNLLYHRHGVYVQWFAPSLRQHFLTMLTDSLHCLQLSRQSTLRSLL